MLSDRVYEWFALWEVAQERGTAFSLDAQDPSPEEREAFWKLVCEIASPTPSISDARAQAGQGVRRQRVGESLPSIPGYEVNREIGRGGMGAVYLARDLKLNRAVAIKIVLGGLLAGPKSMARFLAEAEALAALQHPNIVQVFERGEYEGLPYYVMEHCPNGSLSDRVEERPLPPRAAAELVEQLARAVAAAHARGILHRDLKPANILFAQDDTPKIADFGLAKRFDESGEAGTAITHTGDVIGTPSYMAPEQAKGDTKAIGPAADIYSLGALLYRVLTGRPPFLGANNGETIRQVIHDEPVAPTQLVTALPRDLSTICLKCLAKEPGRRYATSEELSADLRRFLEGKPIVARPVGSIERAVKWVKRNPVITGATVAVVTALAAGTTVSYLKYLDAEAASSAEAERVKERDRVIGERDEAIGKRDIAIIDANDRAEAFKYQLGVTNMVLASNAYDNRDMVLAGERLNMVPPEQRKFEWHYLRRQTRGGMFTIRGHTGAVWSVSYSPDGARIVTGSYDGTAKVWDARTGTALVELKGHIQPVQCVSFSPNGARIVTGSYDGTAKVWDAGTGTELFELKGHMSMVKSVSYSPDGSRIVTGSSDKTAKVWDARTGMALVELNGNTGVVWSVSYSPDGARIVTASYDSARVWDARTGTALVELKGGMGDVLSVSYSPDGAQIVTSSGDSARVWDARMGTALVELRGHTSYVSSVSYSPDGARIVTGSGDKTAKVWDAQTGTPQVELKGHIHPVHSVSFSPDGARIVTGSLDNTAKVWDARTGTPLVAMKGHIHPVHSASFSPDGARILTGSLDNTAKVWDARTGTALVEVKGHTALGLCVSYSPDGTRIVAGSHDGTAKVWDLRMATPLIELKGHTMPVASVCYSPDGARVVTGSHDGTAKVWDARTGTALFELKGHANEVRSVSYSPDGARIVTGSLDNTAKVWDARTGTPLFELQGHNESVQCVSYSPDGARIVTGSYDGTAKVWNAQTGTVLVELKGHTNGVMSVSFSPDGARIVTGSHDNTAKVWDARTGTSLVELRGHASYVSSVSYSPDGTQIITGSWDKTAKVWDAHGGNLLWTNGKLDTNELAYRLQFSAQNVSHYQEVYQAAQREKHENATRFYRERLWAVPPYTVARFNERNKVAQDPRLTARAGFHQPELAKTPYDHGIVQAMAVAGDRLSQRLVAQQLIRDGQPTKAIPLLVGCLVSRPMTFPPKPPVEELLIAKAHLATNKLDDAKRYYKAAADWLDRPRNPMRAANIVTHAVNPWNAIGECFKPVDDPRHNPFDWESWLECDVFRVEVEKQMGR